MPLRIAPGPYAFGIAVLATLATVRPARAAEPSAATTPTASAEAERLAPARSWELGRARPFLAFSIDAGIPYLRPRFHAGYGRPFFSWIGVEAYEGLTSGGLGTYIGAAATLPGLTFRVGGRYFYPYWRWLVAPQSNVTRTELELTGGPIADYLAYEAEVTGSARLFGGSVFGVVTGYRVSQVPPGYFLFEESLHAVIKPPYIWRARLGYAFEPVRDIVRVGPVGEVIGLPGRDAFVVRAGLMASVWVSPAIDVQISLIPVLASPDSLGLTGGDFGQLGLRYRWATGTLPPSNRTLP